MIIPSRPFGVIASGRPRVVVAAPSDVTPNAVNWGNISYDGTAPLENVTITSKQITGINQTITLKLTYTNNGGCDIYYKIAANGNNDNTGVTDATWSGMGYILVANNGQFTVNNNDYVEFTTYPNGNYVGFVPIFTVTVTNVTDSNTVLDTFVANATG
jgi:hypothetical protein